MKYFLQVLYLGLQFNPNYLALQFNPKIEPNNSV